MREIIHERTPKPKNEKQHSPLLLKTVASAALAASFIVPASAEAHRKPSAVERVAAKLERKIQQNRMVDYDASNKIYWSRDGDMEGKFDFATSTPLTAQVAGKKRYFGTEQTGKGRRSIDVFPLPRNALVAQTIYDDFFNCGMEQMSNGKVTLNDRTHLPEVDVQRVVEGDMIFLKQVPLGRTTPYNKSEVLIPPAAYPDPNCPPFPQK